MKFRVQFKDPDVVHDAAVEAAEAELEKMESLDQEEREQLLDSRAEKLTDFASTWVKYGEYITIEFDTEAKTAVVVPQQS